jgi:hypothetical protein
MEEDGFVDPAAPSWLDKHLFGYFSSAFNVLLSIVDSHGPVIFWSLAVLSLVVVYQWERVCAVFGRVHTAITAPKELHKDEEKVRDLEIGRRIARVS